MKDFSLHDTAHFFGWEGRRLHNQHVIIFVNAPSCSQASLTIDLFAIIIYFTVFVFRRLITHVELERKGKVCHVALKE